MNQGREVRRVKRRTSDIVEFEGRRYLVRYGCDVFVSQRSSRGEWHFRRVPHTHTRIIEAVRALACPTTEQPGE